MEVKEKKRKVIIIDFEVLSKSNFWMCCVKEVDTQKKYVLINNKEALKKYYLKNKDSIWVGYNIKGYDQWIFRSILADLDPCLVSDIIIHKRENPWTIDTRMNKFKFNFFELSSGERSLKELELFMGESIEESTVSFDLSSYPTDEEIKELTKYCIHDVDMTYKVFEALKHEFDSQAFLIDFFGLEDSLFKKTKAQLSAYILGAKKFEGKRNDEFEFKVVDTIVLNKYKYIKDWYNTPTNRSYDKSLTANIYGVVTEFGWGGLHAAKKQYKSEGYIVNSDVASFYPSLKIAYNFLSRNIQNPQKYVEIRDVRLKFKAEGDAKEKPFKIVLNGTFGATKDLNNDLYDPLMANAICVNGQLMLLDLIEKVENRFGEDAEFIQGNTDGVMFKFKSEEDIKDYYQICEEWSKRTKMDLDHDVINKVIQKDVNNYLFTKSNGKVKSKGAYVKTLSPIDNDLPIVNKAVKEYLLNGTEIRDTIEKAENLIDFQKCVKVGKTYDGVIHNGKRINLRVLRVFASKNTKDGPVVKLQIKNPEYMDCFDEVQENLSLGAFSTSKIGNTPDKAFILNKNIKDTKVLDNIDREWYISLAEKRLREFLPSCQYEYTLFDMI